MTPDIHFHGVHSIQAHSDFDPSGAVHWITIEVRGEDKEADPIKVTFFIGTPDPLLFAGLIAKAINEAQDQYKRRPI